MRDPATNLDDYLRSRFGVTLERALADACAGVTTLALAHCVEIVCDPVGSYVHDDDGLSEHYQGTLAVEGISYRFRCSMFTDGGGSRFVESIEEFEIVQWGVRLAMPGGSIEAQ
ncbi:MAG TPA: hypothetical protein VN823_05070 [Stellaceae bacterium]|nr:hypothetical protein [Stellaceae bacterium]